MVLKNFVGFFVILAVLASCGESGTDVNTSVPSALSGKELFVNNCAACHGMDGALGVSGASDLSKSKLNTEEIIKILKNGRNGMPAFESILKSKENMDAVTTYTLELRK
jgi:mono/diheme cytochrome c family protein